MDQPPTIEPHWPGMWGNFLFNFFIIIEAVLYILEKLEIQTAKTPPTNNNQSPPYSHHSEITTANTLVIVLPELFLCTHPPHPK